MFKEQYPGDDDSSNDGQQDQQIPVKSETSSTGTMKRVNGGSGHVGGTGGVTPRGRLPSVSAFSEFDFDDSEHSGNASSKEEQSLFTSQTRRSKWSKWLFIAILVVAAAAVSIGVYFFTENQEENDFEHAFDNVAQDVVDSTDLNARNIHNANIQFTNAIGAFLSDDGESSTWPLVTIPAWEQQCEHLRDQTGSTHVLFSPLVLQSQRLLWEIYSVENQDWLQQALEGTGATAAPIIEYIWRRDVNGQPVREDRPPLPYYAPIWQASPPPKDAYGINLNAYDLDFFSSTFTQMEADSEQVVSEVVNLEQAHTTGDDPYSVIFTPIYSSVSEIVGVIMARVLWRLYFSNLLPENVDGILVVVNTACDQVMSYEINGPEATYLGPYDASVDSEFQELEVSHVIEEITSVGDNCPVTMAVYPTQKFYEEYNTSRPWVYCVCALAIFVVAGAVFLLYDWSVRQVQRKTEAQARKTDAIVNSLFPANVRDRLMDSTREELNGKNKKPEDSSKMNGLPGGGDSKNLGASGPGGIAGVGGIKAANSKSLMVGRNLAVDESGIFMTRPIADLFPSATVMFADIVGFTAWSSTREPFQVFTLLETIYNAFDKIAARRRVFKVETIGDCYVACCGLPEPRPDHAVVMGRFAYDCLKRMKSVLARLEIVLGPDTGDLGMRFGLHSGPVTAGVLRGEKSRFQLFGDTVNTAARVENSGARNRIHISSETAEEIEKHGRPSWLVKRDTLVQAKGKGEMQTYWLDFSGASKRAAAANSNAGTDDDSTSGKDDGASVISATNTRASVTTSARLYSRMEQIAKKVEDKKIQRLVGWNVDVLKKQLRLILAMRDPARIPKSIATLYDGEADDDGEEKKKDSSDSINGNDSTDTFSDSSSTPKTTSMSSDSSLPNLEILEIKKEEGKTVLDEVKEIISLPTAVARTRTDPFNIEFTPEVISQLTDYVTSIALMYNDNPFHCFEHASHVTMSVCKLLSRIVTPDSIDYETMEVTKQAEEDLHGYTYGITSDPIAQFACTLAALIHDTDHTGVPNVQLIKENAELAEYYKKKSVAEQNSIDLAWELLMEPQYSELRSCIYTTNDELTRFRQLLVNAVMATDIADKELGALRKTRWEKAFNESSEVRKDEISIREDNNRKATIVIEHLIQASDVSHTMQHWHVFLKWNERLFQEMYKGYLDGRSDTDPSKGWYKGEMGFFDFYLIPLAKKLQECQVFGAASDEYLNYAQANRKEWEVKGEAIVAQYLDNYQKQFGDLERVVEGDENDDTE